MKTPTLETKRILLRPLCKEDATEVYTCWESDPDVAKYMFWTSHNDINKTLEWLNFEIAQIETDNWYRWGFVQKESGYLIGTGLLYFEEEVEKFEIGYNLGKKFWGKGYATEAMKSVINFAKQELGLTEIVARHAKENIASENVIRKLGFEYEEICPYPCNNGTVIMEGLLYRLQS